MVTGQGIARLVTGKTSVTAAGKEVISKEVVQTVLKVSGIPFTIFVDLLN